jgi:hypothetical protein
LKSGEAFAERPPLFATIVKEAAKEAFPGHDFPWLRRVVSGHGRLSCLINSYLTRRSNACRSASNMERAFLRWHWFSIPMAAA